MIDQRSGFRWLPWVEWRINTTYHSTEFTPFEVVYGCPLPVVTSYIHGNFKVHQVDQDLGDRVRILELLKYHLRNA